MFCKLVRPILFIVFLFLSFMSKAQDASEQPYYEPYYEELAKAPFQYQNGSEFGDNVNLFTGRLSVIQTDMVIPGEGGLDINILRWRGGNNNGVAGGWQFHYGVLDYPGKKENPCSWGTAEQHPQPNLTLPGGTQIVFSPEKSYGVESSPSMLISRERWKLVCTKAYEIEVTSPQGLTYTMGYYNQLPTMARRYVTTKIEDRNGNWLNFEYKPVDQYWQGNVQIGKITASDNRIVEIAYSGRDDAALRSVSYAGSVVIAYEYQSGPKGFTTIACLNKVNLLEGQVWKYEYNWSGYLSDHCQIKRITHPMGGEVNYAYFDLVTYNRGGEIKTRSLGSDTTSYSYEGVTWPHSQTTVVHADDSKVIQQFWNIDSLASGTYYLLGLSKNVQFYDVGQTNPVKKIEYSWDYQSIGAKTSGGAFWPDPDFRAAIQTKITTTLDGSVYTTKYSDFDDAYGNPKTVTETGNAGTRTRRFTYAINASKWLLHLPDTESIDGISGNIDHDYDSNGNLISSKKYGVETRQTYYSNGDVRAKISPRGHSTAYESYHRGIPQIDYRPESAPIYRAVDDFGRVTALTNGREYRTAFGYDNLNRITSIDHPRSASADVSIQYTDSGRTRTLTRGNYQQVTTLDGLGRITSVVTTDTASNLSVSQTQNYDSMGRLRFKSHPFSSNSSGGEIYTYDVLGRVKKVTHYTCSDASALSCSFSLLKAPYIEYTYLSDNQVQVKDERGNITTYTYQSYGNPDERYLVRVDAPEGATTKIARNPLGQITSATQGGFTRSYDYYSNRYLKSITDPEIGLTQFGRDESGNMTSRQVGSSPITYFDYDGLNRLFQVRYPDSTGTATYGYDANNNLKSSSFNGVSRGYDYDENDNLTVETLTVNNKLFQTTYVPNSLDQLDQLIYPSGRVVTYAPNALGQPTQAAPYVNLASFHPNGTLYQMEYANGRVSTTMLNKRLWPRTYLVDGSVLDLEYGYDNVGNVESIQDRGSGNHRLSATYDGLGRLGTANGSWGSANFVYDAIGNLRVKTVGARTLNYSYDGLNRLSYVAGAYDDRNLSYTYEYGRVISDNRFTYSYDHANNLIRILNRAAHSTEYSYDADGKRVSKTKDGATRYFVYGKSGQLLGEYRDQGALAKEYIYLAGKSVAQIDDDGSPSTPDTPGTVYLPATGTGGHADSDGNVTVSWASVAQATRYEVQVAANADFTNGLRTACTGSDVTCAITGLNDGTYYVRVRACSEISCGVWQTAGTPYVVRRQWAPIFIKRNMWILVPLPDAQ